MYIFDDSHFIYLRELKLSGLPDWFILYMIPITLHFLLRYGVVTGGGGDKAHAAERAGSHCNDQYKQAVLQ